MQVEPGTGFDVGKRGMIVQEQDQTRSLSEVRCRRASSHEPSRLGEKFFGETRAIVWQWSRHETALPGERSIYLPIAGRQPYTYL